MAAFLMSRGLARFVSSLRRAAGRYEAADAEARDVRIAAPADDDFAAPYTVQWSERVGEWIVWLPAGSLVVGGSAIDITTALTAAGNGYPAGWYRLGISASASAVYLVITPGATVTATFADSASSAAGTTSILVARMSGKAVVQSVGSAIVLGGDSHMGNATGSVVAFGAVTFASASDSCVEVLTSANGVVSVGVYYV